MVVGTTVVVVDNGMVGVVVSAGIVVFVCCVVVIGSDVVIGNAVGITVVFGTVPLEVGIDQYLWLLNVVFGKFLWNLINIYGFYPDSNPLNSNFQVSTKHLPEKQGS